MWYVKDSGINLILNFSFLQSKLGEEASQELWIRTAESFPQVLYSIHFLNGPPTTLHIQETSVRTPWGGKK